MLDREHVTKEWLRQGYCRLPGLFDEGELRRYRENCDRILHQWLSENQTERSTNMAFLTELRYFQGREEDLSDLLELIADERILSVLRTVSGQEPLFHGTQYFFEQPRDEWNGVWHRDTQFLAEAPELEKKRMQHHTSAHFRIAFTDDPWLEYVPGSEKRWDTAEELAIRRSEDESHRAHPEMPGKVSLALEPGESLIFHAWGIHRGSYHTHPPRRTLDFIYGWDGICDYWPPPATCFDGEDGRNRLSRLSPGARQFFGRFVDIYRPLWESSAKRGNG